MASHPYYPVNLSLPHYNPMEHTPMQILTGMFGTFGIILITSYLLIRKREKSFGTQLQFLWFVLCAAVHLGIEGYYVVNHLSLAGDTSFMGDLWKEYSKSDSRYLSNDSFVLIMESITAAGWGPLSILIAYLIYTQNAKRHLPIVLVSLGQIYGDVLYYLTTLYEGAPHGDPHPYYFYFYFVTMNAFWIVFPSITLYSSSKAILQSLAQTQAKEKTN
ncbi:Emopamil-binding protein [Conidiobolus coronatus NRRL 28638]|uniref:Emopamil-binding protein n=1 Tax=Conidiobolus coronatus (strain ATCC 28846 / CBS 209.66 / NRRL 28638) TaxID=796925 RepID=A0A137P3C3_CONC2|nr:Emopamil-binding protein [Conidiobolus coronatus NRRL 28638]|eukprot:KXN69523.1 Emopamil-binding protein [Conidiobolus coronatus NRRL 28638]